MLSKVFQEPALDNEVLKSRNEHNWGLRNSPLCCRDIAVFNGEVIRQYRNYEATRLVYHAKHETAYR